MAKGFDLAQERRELAEHALILARKLTEQEKLSAAAEMLEIAEKQITALRNLEKA